MPNLSWTPATVPTKENFGPSGSFGLGTTAAGFTMGLEATAGAGGRRDDEKIGRSRVPDNAASGMTHIGLLALSARPSMGASGAPAACAGAAGLSEIPAAAGGSTGGASWVSAETPCDDNARAPMPIANLSIVPPPG